MRVDRQTRRHKVANQLWRAYETLHDQVWEQRKRDTIGSDGLKKTARHYDQKGEKIETLYDQTDGKKDVPIFLFWGKFERKKTQGNDNPVSYKLLSRIKTTNITNFSEGILSR